MAKVPPTDFLQLSSGLYVPPDFVHTASEKELEKRRELDRRFFAADSKTGKFFTTFGQYGNNTAAGGQDKPRDTANFTGLRRLYNVSPIDKLIVLARKHQMRYVSRRSLIPQEEVGWKVVHKRSLDPTFENDEDIERRCRHMEEIIERVNTQVIPGGFRAFLLMMVEDELIYDRKVAIIARDNKDLPAAYWTVDPTCYSSDTEVLTRNGWKLFKDVNIDIDEFATRNKETHELEYQKAYDYHEAEKNEDLYHFYSRSVDILVTGNHRMLVAPNSGHNKYDERTVPAEELYSRMNNSTTEWVVPSTSVWDVSDLDEFVLCFNEKRTGSGGYPRKVSLSGDDFAAFLGMYIAEGCVVSTGVPRRDTIYITQLEKSKGFVEFHDLLKRILGREPGYDGHSFHFKRELLSRYLRPLGHAHEKYVPDEVKNLSKRQLEIFWHYYWLGDGNIDKRGNVTASTSSKRLADDLQEVVQKIGFSSQITTTVSNSDKHVDGRVIKLCNIRPQYTLYLRTSDYHKVNVEKVQYSGKVYCVSVPNETLYVRRKDKPSWCNNTIKPRVETLSPWMVKHGVKNFDVAAERMSFELYSNGIRDVNGSVIDLTTADYIQELEGQIVGAWSKKEIDVDVTNPVNSIDHYFYGKPIFEESIEWTDGFMAPFNYNANWFRSKVPEQLIFLAGEVDAEGYDSFQKQMLGQGNGSTKDHRVALITGDKEFKVNVQPMRATMQDMAFPGWIRFIVAGKAGCYRMDPRIINFDLASGNDTNFFKNSDREGQLTLSNEEGFHTIAQNFEDWVNRVFVWPRYDDLCFRFVGLKKPDPKTEQMMLANSVITSTLNEVRNQSGALPPIELPGYPELGDIPLNPSILPIMQYLDQKRMMQSQMNQANQQQQFAQENQNTLQPDQPDTSGIALDPNSKPAAGSQPQSGGTVLRQARGGQEPVQKSFMITVKRE